MRNAGSTTRRQRSGRPHSARTDDNVYFVNELILSQKGAPNSKKAHIKFHKKHEFIIFRYTVSLLKLKCLKKRQAQELIVANSRYTARARKLLRCFQASAVDSYFSLMSLFH